MDWRTSRAGAHSWQTQASAEVLIDVTTESAFDSVRPAGPSDAESSPICLTIACISSREPVSSPVVMPMSSLLHLVGQILLARLMKG